METTEEHLSKMLLDQELRAEETAKQIDEMVDDMLSDDNIIVDIDIYDPNNLKINIQCNVDGAILGKSITTNSKLYDEILSSVDGEALVEWLATSTQ